MPGYTKLFSRILDSTIWREDDKTRILWITMLAMANKDGVVESTVPGLADRARISLQECELALDRFQQPDKYSWSKEEEGRRIRVVEGGWFLINHDKYRRLLSQEDQREKTRLRVARFREKNALRNDSVTPSNDSNDKQIQKQIQIQKKESTSNRGTRIPEGFTITENLRNKASAENLPSPDLHIAEFIDYWIAVPGQRGLKLDWDATFCNWLRKAKERSHFVRDNHKTAAQLRDERSSEAIERAFRKVEASENLSIPFRQRP